MIRKLSVYGLLFLTILSCKNETFNTDSNSKLVSNDTKFIKLLESYNEEAYALDPMVATNAGDSRYNSEFPEFLSVDYKAKKKAYYNSYKSRLSEINNETLNATEKMSLAVLNWDIDINLEAMGFKKDLMPIDQMWSKNLDFNQLASASNAQPFKTVQDYKDWMTRVDNYLVWLNSTIANMKSGITEGYVLPKPLIKKVIPQFETLASGAVEDHLYYEPIKMLPDSFSAEDKEAIIDDYRAMISDKLMPTHKMMVDFLKNEYLPNGRSTSGIDATSLRPN